METQEVKQEVAKVRKEMAASTQEVAKVREEMAGLSLQLKQVLMLLERNVAPASTTALTEVGLSATVRGPPSAGRRSKGI